MAMMVVVRMSDALGMRRDGAEIEINRPGRRNRDGTRSANGVFASIAREGCVLIKLALPLAAKPGLDFGGL
jgi:hypothetical protein